MSYLFVKGLQMYKSFPLKMKLYEKFSTPLLFDNMIVEGKKHNLLIFIFLHNLIDNLYHLQFPPKSRLNGIGTLQLSSGVVIF